MDAPPFDIRARAMSCTAIEQSMPSYHSPVILRKVEVANWRNHVIKIFFQKFDFCRKKYFFEFFYLIDCQKNTNQYDQGSTDPFFNLG